MLKQLSILVVLSLVLLIFAQQSHAILLLLDNTHRLLNEGLSQVFSTSSVGNTTQEVLCLMFIPLAIAAIPAIVYWLIKRRPMPYFYHVMWAIWIVLYTSLSLTRVS